MIVLASAAALAAPAHAADQILVERFETSVTGTFPPAGWSEVDINGSGLAGWEAGGAFCSNLGGGDIAGHDASGIGTTQDTRLVSPSMDFSAVAAPQLRFHSGGCNAWALATSGPLEFEEHDVEVSTDGGATWTEVWTADTGGAASYEQKPVVVDLSSYAGNATVQVGFRYFGEQSQWAVDTVVVVDAGTAGALYMVGNCGDPGSYVFADGVTPLATVAFAFSRFAGSRIYSSPACPVLVSGLETFPANVVAVAQATSFGYAQVIPPNGIPAGACGGYVQAFDLATCLPTPVMQL
jgi:hypothetical protein